MLSTVLHHEHQGRWSLVLDKGTPVILNYIVISNGKRSVILLTLIKKKKKNAKK